jgi:4-hydroxy-tetrahydrodipicolinate reductase
MTRMLVERGATVVGAVAATPEKNGKDVGELVGLDEPLGVRVYTDPDEALALKPDIVIMSIASYMEDMYEPITRCIKAGVNVISLAEELLYSTNPAALQTGARPRRLALIGDEGRWLRLCWADPGGV